MKMVRKQLRGISRLSHSTIKRLPRQEIFGETCFFNTLVTDNGRFLRHRFSPKPTSVATAISLPKRNHVAKEAVSAAWQTKTRQRSERICKTNDAPRTKPRPCVKTMLHVSELRLRSQSRRRVCPFALRGNPSSIGCRRWQQAQPIRCRAGHTISL